MRRTLTKKRFWIATLLVPGLLVVIFAISFASGSSSDAATQAQSNTRFTFEYVDSSNLIDPALARRPMERSSASVDQGVADVKSGSVTAFFVYPADPTKQPIEVYGVNDGLFGNGKYATVATNLLKDSATQKIGSPS